MIDDFDKLSVTELRQRGMPSDQILAEQKRRGMSKEQINDAWFPKPAGYNRIGTRRFRRRLVIATYGGWLLLAAALKLATLTSPHFPALPFLSFGFAIVLLVWFARKTYISRAVLESDAGLDERLVQTRNQAFRRAFQLLAIVAIIAWPLSLVSAALQPGPDGWLNASLIYYGFAILATTLPTAIWAWLEPDPVDPNSV